VPKRVFSWLFLILFLSLASSLVADPALAHAKPNKSSFPAGSTQDVRFIIEHGCGNSPTTSVSVRLPADVTAVKPIATAGWKVALDASKRVVTWSGGSLPANEQGSFPVRMTFPKTKNITLSFPMAQTCKIGKLRWVEGPTSPYPAPVVRLT
jgi:periplasmic copper chaperone A